jgi:hypothetical protein
MVASFMKRGRLSPPNETIASASDGFEALRGSYLLT